MQAGRYRTSDAGGALWALYPAAILFWSRLLFAGAGSTEETWVASRLAASRAGVHTKSQSLRAFPNSSIRGCFLMISDHIRQ